MRRSQPLPRQDMFEVKPPAMAKKESSTETDEGLGSSGKRCGSGSFGSVSAGSGASLYLSDSQDWVISPSCSPDEPPAHHHHHHHALSPMLAEETFRYMILSGDRVEQMAKTYNDIEVVTHLLVERDRDLELAARIGQSLLQRNNLLQERNEAVEEQLALALDQVNQLQHELAKKDELLRMVASASEESETDSSCSTPHRQPPHHHHHHGGISAAAALSQLEALQSKLQEMEEENLALRSEACHLKSETITYEEKEQQLVSDCVKELRESNSQMVSLTEELSKKNQDLLKHQEEIAQLLSQIVDLQHRVKELALEKEELRIHLQASKDSQRQLTAELNELTERNAECVGMLHESQEEIKELRNKNTPSAGMRRHLSYGLYPMDSLAAEIEGTMRRELSVEEEMSVQEQRDALEPLRISQKKVFQTVRAVKASASASARSFSPVPPIPGSGRSSLVMTAQPFTSNQGDEANRLGQPGSPGRNDLTEALHRLSLRRHNFLCEQQFFLTERERKLQALQAAAAGEEGEEPAEGSVCGSTPSMGSRLSSYSNLSELSLNTAIFKTFLPEKLQIVKPMEGSLTLHHWQQLAKPHLGTILDPHPGVVTKGFRPLAQDAVYRLTDLEEDEEDNGNEDRSRRGGGQGGKRLGGGREKGSAEEAYAEDGIEEDDEEEEGGITFKARCSSTPEEKERKHPPPPLCSPALRSGSPITTTTSSSSSSPPRPDLSLDFGGSDVIVTPSFPPARSISTSPTLAAPVQSESSCFATPVTMTTTTTTTAAATTGSSSDACPVLNPGKCQCSTFSTYTFTTCRILHPSDITQVTSSSYPQSSSSSSSLSTQPANTPSSMRTGPNTPVTPCRLSLGDSFPPSLRRPLAAAPPPGRLAKLVLEKGISAQGISRTAASAAPAAAATDNFLASRPAELFLQDVYGLNLGRAPTHPDLPSPSTAASSTSTTATIIADNRDKEETTSQARSRANSSSSSASAGPPVGLMERLCRLGFSKVLQGTTEQTPPQNHHHHRRQDSSTFVVAAGGGSLLDGLRRNQSLPAMIGGGGGGGAARGHNPNPLPHPQPPPHPTSLAIPPPPWGDLKDRRRRPASVSHLPGPSAKN